jgi:hypothetical protein
VDTVIFTNAGARMKAAVVVAGFAFLATACGGSGSSGASPAPSTSSVSPSVSATPSPTASPSNKNFLAYLHQNGVPRGRNSKNLIALGKNFVCASYRFHETTPQIMRVAKKYGIHPQSRVELLMRASLTYICPQYQATAALPSN